MTTTASARSTKHGYKAVIVHRSTLPSGYEKTRTEVVGIARTYKDGPIGKTFPDRESAVAAAQRTIDARIAHRLRA